AAREAKDFAKADELREEIHRAGFDVVDTPGGWTLRPRAASAEAVHRRVEDVPSLLDEPPTAAFSVQWVDQGWPQDIERGIASFGWTHAGRPVQHIVVEASLDRTSWHGGVDVVRLDPSLGRGASRRELLDQGVGSDGKSKCYRTADIELCFHLKAMGYRAVVVPIPVTRHEHRMWAATPEEQRSRLSKRNFYRFLDRWRGRTDLLVSAGRGRTGRD